MNFRSNIVRAFCLALLLSPGTAVAQSAFGLISGGVADSSGAAIPAATVMVVNEANGTSQTTQTDTSGYFVFPALLPATYTVTAGKQGFEKLEKTGFVLLAAQELSVGTLQLSVGSTKTSVVVSGASTPVQTASSEVSANLSAPEIQALPSLGRDYMAFMRVLPGSQLIGEGSTSLGVGGSRALFNGQGDTATGWGTYVSTNGVWSSTWEQAFDSDAASLDNVQDINVLEGNYGAEYGRMAGSVVNVTTPSGTSQFHGGVYYYLRNEALNATDFFTNRVGGQKARYRYNTYGVNFGGPVDLPGGLNSLRQKLFFFFNFDDEPLTVPAGPRYYLMPTDLERQGDFSQSLIPGTNVPYTILNPSTGQPYQGNVIPASQINPLMAKMLTIFPEPNFTNRVVSLGTYNYVINDSDKEPTDRESLRLDYAPVPTSRIFGRWQRSFSGNCGRNEPGLGAGWQTGTECYDNTNERGEAGVTWTINPHIVNEISGGFTHNHEVLLAPESELSQFQLTTLGINFPNPTPSLNTLGLLPAMSFGGYSGWSYEPRYPLNDLGPGWSITDGFTDVMRSHQLKFGVYFDQMNNWQPHNVESAGAGGAGSGAFSFSAPNPSIPDNAGNAMAQALLGDFANVTYFSNRVNYNGWMEDFEWYAQDNWRVTKKLTLNYGLRFTDDISQRNASRFGSMLNFSQYSASEVSPLFQPVTANGINYAQNPTTGGLEPAAYVGYFVPGVGSGAPGSVSVANKPLFNWQGVKVAPRFGFAYDPFGTGKTVIRGGFGMFYAPRTRWGEAGAVVANAPSLYANTEYYGDISSVASAGALHSPTTMFYFNPNNNLPYQIQWSLGVQREVGFKSVLGVSYVANVSHFNEYDYNLNEIPYGAQFLPQNWYPGTSTPLPSVYYVPYPGYSSIIYFQNGNNANYNSLQVTLNRKFAHNLTYGVAYTWSKDLEDNRSTTYLPSSLTYGPGSLNMPNRLTFDWVWTLPNASSHWNNFLSRSVLNGWEFSGITSFISGEPDSAGCTTTNGENITGGGDGYRCIVTGNAVLPKGQRTFNRYFNTGVFAIPSVYTPGEPLATQNIGNQWTPSFYGPGVNNWDLSLFKNFVIHEKVTAQVRFDFFNAFNHTQFSSVNTSATFNPATGQQVNAAFGQLNADYGPRVIQAIARISF